MRRRARLGVLVLLVAAISWDAILAAPDRRTPGRFDRADMAGSGPATMQPTSVGTNVFLTAAVPGDPSTAWAIGRTTALVPGWAGTADGGQTVFMRYARGRGWSITGPALDAAGRPVNPTFTAAALTAGGEGWAVGDRGVTARLTRGEWRTVPAVTASPLHAVSLAGRDGFAAGDGGTILRLRGDAWRPDTVAGDLDDVDFIGVAALSESEGWAVGALHGESGSRSMVIARRGANGWVRQSTGLSFVDGPHPVTANNVAYAASYGTAVAANKLGVWLAGTLVPLDAAGSINDPAGDGSRPFVVYFDRSSGRFTTYCPDRYELSTDGKAAVVALCDQPFPLTPFDITDMQAFDGPGRGEVFAAGLGLFHYLKGEWVREPNVVGFVSSFGLSSPTEGWIASSGETIGVGGGGFGRSSVLGHWTTAPAQPRVARWSQPNKLPLEAVAVAPDGSGRALAVGQDGAIVWYRPDVGWETFTRRTIKDLHGVAWPEPGRAWIVGESALILSFDGTSFNGFYHPDGASLFGVAFSSPDRGYAVGRGGVILAFDGDRWKRDPASRVLTTETLYAVAAAAGRFVAVGDRGVVLVNDGSGWRREDVSPLVRRGARLPALYAVAGNADGTVYAGGELSTLIRRDPRSGAWRVDREGARVPPEGTILALAAPRSSGAPLLASVGSGDLKFHGDNIGAHDGWILSGDRRGWHDLQLASRATVYPTYDASSVADATFGFALEGTSGKAWAVGGTPAWLDDGEGHEQATPSSSVYRYDPAGDPSQPATDARVALPPGGVSFAYFGESACGRGLCGVTVGSGTKADVVALQIRDEINRMAAHPGGPKFVFFGGNMRRLGIPEEIGAFKRYLAGFRIPVFAALGNLDLFSGLQAPSSDDGVSPDNSFVLNAFADRPAPWGHAPAPAGFLPVAPPGSAEARTGAARTHYGFDYAPQGRRLVRFLVLDDSTGSLSNTETQNPRQDQKVWLQNAITEADVTFRIPTVVVMNRPTHDPLASVPQTTTMIDSAQFTTTVTGKGVSAVFASHFRENAVYFLPADRVPGAIPVYVSGGGGAPLGGSRDASLGYYHSWVLGRVDTDAQPTLTGQKPVEARYIPVLESLTMHADDGVVTTAGNTLRFEGLGRAPDGGGPGDPLQSEATYVPIPQPGACLPLCVITRPMVPSYRFESDDPSVGYFVRPDPQFGDRPYIGDDDRPVPDESSGLFCAVGAGETYVNLISGFHRARMKVTVDGGFGPCVKQRVPPIVKNKREVPPVIVPPVITSPTEEVEFRRGRAALPLPVLFPPPPPPAGGPPPPGAPGIGRKEEQEYEAEQQGYSDENPKAHRFSVAERRRPVEDALPIGAALLAALFGAASAAAALRRRVAEGSVTSRWR